MTIMRGATLAPVPQPAVPGPKPYPIVGLVPKLLRDPLGFFVRAAREYGDVVYLQLGPRGSYLVTHPDDIKRVLQDNNRNYLKGYDVVKPLVGEGLLSSEGEFWRRQRRLMQPAFHRGRIASMAPAMVEATQEMLARWRPYAESGRPFDIAAEMMRLTQEIIVKTMFSTSIGADAEVAAQAFSDTLAYMNQLLLAPLPWLHRLPLPSKRRFYAAIRTLDAIVYRIIAERRASASAPDDLLGMLVNARDPETGEGMSDRQIRDEVMTIFLAGHETTANALAWVWHLLAEHPQVDAAFRDEVEQVLGGRPPTADDVPNLPYTGKILSEALRLYPPAWMFARMLAEEDTLGGYRLPAGAMLMISPYVTHRDPRWWPDPERFDPERFAPEQIKTRPRFAYFPFSGGPRVCIGEPFAWQEAILVMALVAQTYRLRPAPGYAVTPQPMATLRPAQGVKMVITGL